MENDLEFKSLAEIEKPEAVWTKTLLYWEPLLIHSKIAKQHWKQIKDYFPNYQLFLFENEELIGFANTLPFYWDQPLEALPDGGWDWMVQHAIQQFEQKRVPNFLGGLQIVVMKEHRRKGFSKIILEEVKRRFQNSELKNFVLPIRPILKHEYQKIPMEIYLKMKNNGKILDPWIRLHNLSGAKTIRVCPKSMAIEGSKRDWEEWMDLEIKGSGYYALDGGLSPLYYHQEKDLGTYQEPNIWIYYE